MSSSTFQPYGLVKSAVEEALYHRAHIANVHTGIADPKEHETSALMEVILYSNIFTTRDSFIVNSQQPPASGSEKRCDIVIRYLEQGTSKIRVLCFAECKRSRTSHKFSLKALEKQASEYCRSCLENEEDMEFVYAATMAGAHIRLWTHRRHEDRLVPFWGNDIAGEWSEYKDVGNDQSGRDLEYWFGQMKQFPPTPHAGQSSHSYGTPSTVPLGYQASPPGQLPGPSYQDPASSYQASTTSGLSYEASASSYRASPSGPQVPIVGYHASPSLPAAQPVEASEHDQPMSENIDDNGDDQIKEEVETQQAAKSSGGYQIVRVRVVRNTFSKDDIIFKDSRGKSRPTIRDDWDKITYNGEIAWKYHKYVCFDDVLDH